LSIPNKGEYVQNTLLNEADVARYNELGKRVGLDYDGSWWNQNTLEMAEMEERAAKQGMGFVNRDNTYTLEKN